MRPGILPEHSFKHKGNHYATLLWFGTQIAQKHAKRIKTKTGSTQVFVVTWNATFSCSHVLMFSTSGQRQVTTCCTCAVTCREKCHVSGCHHQAGEVCCLSICWGKQELVRNCRGKTLRVKGNKTAAWLAQLVERQTAVREVEGSSPRPDQHSGS